MIENTIYFNKLYDYYGSLLTDTQQQYFEDYYFQNLTCQEIGENKGVSRNAVNKQINDALGKLEYYEEKLGLYKKNKQLEDFVSKIKDEKVKEEIKRIIWE